LEELAEAVVCGDKLIVHRLKTCRTGGNELQWLKQPKRED